MFFSLLRALRASAVIFSFFLRVLRASAVNSLADVTKIKTLTITVSETKTERGQLFASQTGEVLEEPEGLTAGKLHQPEIGDNRADSQLGQAGLLGPEKLSRTSDLQVFPGDLKTIIDILDRLQPTDGILGAGVSLEDTVGRVARPPYPPPELVKLGETEPLGILDQHYGGVGDIAPEQYKS